MDALEKTREHSWTQEMTAIRDIVKRAVRDDSEGIDWGLEQPLKYYSMDVPIAIGVVDLLLADISEHVLHVVQIIPGTATAEDVGRLSAYLGWFQQTPPDTFGEVKGVLLSESFSADASLAIKIHPCLVAKTFMLTIQVSAPESNRKGG